MKLIYTETKKEVEVGDEVKTFRGDMVSIKEIIKPHKSSSTGLVRIIYLVGPPIEHSVYPSVVGAEWIEREDRAENIERVARPSNKGARPFHASTRVTDEEDKLLRAASAALKVDHANWLRSVLLDAAKKVMRETASIVNTKHAEEIFGKEGQ